MTDLIVHDHSSDIQGGSTLKPNWTPKITSQTAAYTARANEVVLVPSGTFTVSLISAIVAKKNSIICVTNQGSGTVTLDGYGSETIDGSATVALAQYESRMIMSTGTNWVTLSAETPGGLPGGSDTQVQFNDGSTFGGDSAFTWNKTSNTLTVGTVVLTGTATVPTGPVAGELCYHTPTGRKVLLLYNGTTWTSIVSVGTFVVYVDKTDGTDAADKGTAVDAAAYKTIQYAVDQIPGLVGGNVTININAETYIENVIIQGKSFSGNYTITLQGTRSSLDSLTSSASTQGTGATQGTVVRGAGTWTASARANKLVRFTAGVNSGLTRVIDSNTTTTLTIVGTWSGGAPGTDTFVVEDWGTVIAPSAGTAVLIKPGQLGVNLTDIKMVGNTTGLANTDDVSALWVDRNAVCTATYCWATCVVAGGIFPNSTVEVRGTLTWTRGYINTATSTHDRTLNCESGFECRVYQAKFEVLSTGDVSYAAFARYLGYLLIQGSVLEGTSNASNPGANGIYCLGNTVGVTYVDAPDGQNQIRNWAVGIRAETGAQVIFTTSATYNTFTTCTANTSVDANSSHIT